MKSILMQRDILLKVWLFLFRPKHAKEKKQRLSSSFLLDDDTLRGTKRFAVAKPTRAKHVEREEIPQKEMGNEMMR